MNKRPAALKEFGDLVISNMKKRPTQYGKET